MKSKIETPIPVTRSEAMREENPQKTSGLPALSGNEQEQGAPVTKLVIDRSRWLRGEGSADSYLLRRRDEKMCCLGFYGVALGLEDLLPGALIPSLTADPSRWPRWLVKERENSGQCYQLSRENDRREDPDCDRERRIAELFAEHGVEVTFVDAAGPVESESPEAKKGPDHP